MTGDNMHICGYELLLVILGVPAVRFMVMAIIDYLRKRWS